MPTLRLLALLALPACSWITPSTVCSDPSGVLQDADDPLTCEEALVASDYVAVLAARSVSRADRNLLYRDLAARYRAEPADVNDDLASMARLTGELRALRGLEAAEARSRRAYEALTGKGPLDIEAYPQAGRIVRSQIVARVIDDDHELVFTEMDIEGWISYASLCREAQAGGPLKLSIANREQLYRDLIDGYKGSDRDGRIAMVAIGAFWEPFTERWQAASYEEQQAWIQAAPLPPPMTASSMGYASSVWESGDFTTHARLLHEKMGPLRLGP